MLMFGLRLGHRPARRRHDDAAADQADPRAARRPDGRGDARHDLREPRQPGAGVSRPDRAPLRGHAARPPGARRRDPRGRAGRLVEPRRHRGGAACAPRPTWRIVVAIDPAASSGEDADETGIVVAGKDGAGARLCAGRSVGPLRADGMGARRRSPPIARIAPTASSPRSTMAARWSRRRCAWSIPNVPFTAVHASRGKVARAEPVAALYEQGRVHHLGAFPQLEDQMCASAGRTTNAEPARGGFPRPGRRAGLGADRAVGRRRCSAKGFSRSIAGSRRAGRNGLAEARVDYLSAASRGAIGDAARQGREHDDPVAVDRTRQQRQPGAGACAGLDRRGVATPVGATAPLPVINTAGSAAVDGSGTVAPAAARRPCSAASSRQRLPRAEQFLGDAVGLGCRRRDIGRRVDPDCARAVFRDALGLQAGRRGQPLRRDDRPGLRRAAVVEPDAAKDAAVVGTSPAVTS